MPVAKSQDDKTGKQAQFSAGIYVHTYMYVHKMCIIATYVYTYMYLNVRTCIIYIFCVVSSAVASVEPTRPHPDTRGLSPATSLHFCTSLHSGLPILRPGITYIHVYTCTCICVYVRICMCTCVCVHACVCVYIITSK